MNIVFKSIVIILLTLIFVWLLSINSELKRQGINISLALDEATSTRQEWKDMQQELIDKGILKDQ